MATWLAEICVIRCSIYKLISIYLRAFVGAIIVYIWHFFCFELLSPIASGIFVHKVALGQGFLQELRLPLCTLLTTWGQDIKSVVK